MQGGMLRFGKPGRPSLSCTSLLLLGLSLLLPAQAGIAASGDFPGGSQSGFRAGVHYQLVKPPQPTRGGERVEVVELLWFGCRTCFAVQPQLQRWRERNQAVIHYRRMPAVANEDMIFFARAFYAAQALGVLDTIHDDLYTAIHRQRRRLDDEQALSEFFAEHGVDPQAFRTAMRSTFTTRKVRQARIMSRRYGIRGAPSIIIDGRYRVDPGMVRDVGEMMAVLDFLLLKAAADTPAGKDTRRP